MASSKEYVDFVLEQCEGLSARAMMGEYVLYYNGKVVGGVYDNRLLVKPVQSARVLMPGHQKSCPTRVREKCCLLKISKTESFYKSYLQLCVRNCQNRKRRNGDRNMNIDMKKNTLI